MTIRLTKVDGGFQLLIPDELALKGGLTEEAELIVTAEDGRFAVESAPRKQRPTLEELLAKVTDDNIHGEVDWGPPVGKERFWE